MSSLLLLRYKYLQKPLQETSLPGLLQYANRWPQPQREKIGVVIGLLLAQGIVTASVLLSLTKDHLVKNGNCLVIYIVFPFSALIHHKKTYQ